MFAFRGFDWAGVPRDRDVPTDVQALLVKPLFGRGSVLISQMGPLCLGLTAIVTIGGPVPTILSILYLAATVPRLVFLYLGNQDSPPGRPPNIVRYRLQYQVCGLLWATTCSAEIPWCIASHEDLVRLAAVTVAAGISGAIASRNAGTPRYAMTLLTIWLLPPLVTFMALGPRYWIIVLLSGCYFAVLMSVVRQQYGDLRALIDAETRSATAQAALRTSEEMLQLSMNVGRVGSFRRDFQTQMIHCGTATQLMHALPAGDASVPFTTWDALILPEDRAQLLDASITAHAAHQKVNDSHYRFLHPVHGMRHIEARDRTEYDETGAPVSAVGVIIDVTERRLAEARIAHLAHHDPLTELPNRALFKIRLDEALVRARSGEPFALLSLDLDRFKAVNDTFGHATGDTLLRAVTARLNMLIRPTDTVARVGGDEFAVIQSNVRRPSDSAGLAERVIAALGEPFDLDGQHVLIGASVGITVAPDDGMDPQTLLSRADTALYAAKAQGRGRHRRFETYMDSDLQARRTLESDLRQALESHEFELFYQPIVDLKRRTISGFEALLRWHHPTRGLVLPGDFIPLAETTKLVVPIGAWVLRQACAEAASWADGSRIAVNLSAVQLAGSGLVETVVAALRLSGLDPRRLELEITETAVLQDTETTLTTLHQLRALGVALTMDDFGTGCSSLGYLQRMPFDKVKIDPSYTSQLTHTRESAAIVSAVIGLCSSLNMLTTARGVGTLEQFEALVRSGCSEAQGYYFSPPQPAAAIPAMRTGIGALFRGRDGLKSAVLACAGLSGSRSLHL